MLTLLNSLNFNPPPNQWSDFHNPAWSIYQVSNIMALTAILMWLKLLRYLQLSARLSQLTQVRVRVRVRARVRVRVLTLTLALTLTLILILT